MVQYNIDLWEKAHKAKTFNMQYPSSNAQAFLRYHVKKKGKLLDHGCGNGIHSFFFKEAGLDVYAIDSSESALEYLRSCNTKNDIKCDLGNFTNMPYNDDMFHYIFSEGVLYYGDEEAFILGLNEIYRCLKPGGIVRIYTKTNQDYWVKHGQFIGNDTYLAIDHPFEANMYIYCVSKERIMQHMKKYSDVILGIEEFNYVGLEDKKSFWVITAKK